ncbi:MAG: hypothetical protein LBR74_09880 [Eubacterium sp.]|jgi:hypothetical protein|nr:hypothetical protein [Eubacterium sp.]
MNQSVEKFKDDKYEKEMIDGQVHLFDRNPTIEHNEVRDNLMYIFNNYFKQNDERCRARSNGRVVMNEKKLFCAGRYNYMQR